VGRHPSVRLGEHSQRRLCRRQRLRSEGMAITVEQSDVLTPLCSGAGTAAKPPTTTRCAPGVHAYAPLIAKGRQRRLLVRHRHQHGPPGNVHCGRGDWLMSRSGAPAGSAGGVGQGRAAAEGLPQAGKYGPAACGPQVGQGRDRWREAFSFFKVPYRRETGQPRNYNTRCCREALIRSRWGSTFNPQKHIG